MHPAPQGFGGLAPLAHRVLDGSLVYPSCARQDRNMLTGFRPRPDGACAPVLDVPDLRRDHLGENSGYNSSAL